MKDIIIYLDSSKCMKEFPQNKPNSFTNLFVSPIQCERAMCCIQGLFCSSKFGSSYFPSSQPTFITAFKRQLPKNRQTLQNFSRFSREQQVFLPSDAIWTQFDFIREFKDTCNNPTRLDIDYRSKPPEKVMFKYPYDGKDMVVLLIVKQLAQALFDSSVIQSKAEKNAISINNVEYLLLPLKKWREDRSGKYVFLASKSPVQDILHQSYSNVMAIEVEEIRSGIASTHFKSSRIGEIFTKNFKVVKRHDLVPHYEIESKLIDETTRNLYSLGKPGSQQLPHYKLYESTYSYQEFANVKWHSINESSLKAFHVNLLDHTGQLANFPQNSLPTILKLAITYQAFPNTMRKYEEIIHFSSKHSIDKSRINVGIPMSLKLHSEDKRWYAAITSISFPTTFELQMSKAERSILLIMTTFNELGMNVVNDQFEIEIPNHCRNVFEIADSIKLQTNGRILIEITDLGCLKIKRKPEVDLYCRMSRKMYEFLGTSPTIEQSLESRTGIKRTGEIIEVVAGSAPEAVQYHLEFGSPPQFHKYTPKLIWVEGDFIEETCVADKRKKLLGVVNLGSTPLGQYFTKDFSRLDFFKVDTSNPREMAVTLKDENEEFLQFASIDGKSDVHITVVFTTNPS